MEPTTTSTNQDGDVAGKGLSLNERLMILLKEYDALRKEAEQSLALMPDIAKSIGIVLAGALIGAHKDALGTVIALCAAPVIMAALGAVAHTHAKLEATSRRLMNIEDRVLRMTGEPLLTHETRMNIPRTRHGGGRWIGTAIIATAFYFWITGRLYHDFCGAFLGLNQDVWKNLYWILVGISGAYACFSAIRIGWQRRHIPRTELLRLEELRVAKQ